MKIGIVGPTHPYKGGIAQHTTELAHRLAGRGHDVGLHSWSAQYPARLYPGQQRVAEPELEPFPATDYPLSWRRPDSWLRLGRRLRGGADAVVLVVVTPVQAPAYLGVLAGLGVVRGLGGASGTRRSRRPRPPVLALCHNVLPHERRAADERLVRAVLRRVHAVVVHTPAEAELARELTGRPVSVAAMAAHLWTSERLRPVGGLDDPGLDDPDPGRDGGSGAGESAPVRRRLLFFGLVRPYKGLDVLLRALAAGPADVELTVAGEFWGGVASTEALVAELGLAGRVELRPGYVPAEQVPGLFAAADALVLPYRSGTASQNVDLAHLHGLPVVASRVGTLADGVADGVDGLLVPPGDAAALAAALRRLYEPGVLAAMRAKVVAPAVDETWSAYLDTVERALGQP
jgi:glycosyltransferase involved in cell wall biosynthesis